MSSLSRELVFLILQFLDEEKFKETVHKLEKESGFFFNMRYFEDSVTNGEWEEVEKYLSGFTKVDDNRYSMKIFFEIRKQKYLEALDKRDHAKAVEILAKDLKVFSTFNEELFKEITMLLTLQNFRENDQLSKYGDTKSARAIMLVELKKLIEANPLFRDKLQFPTLKNSRLRTLINQSLNWQHQLCKNPKPNPDIKTLFVDHSCGQSNGARAPSPVTNPLMGSIPKVGGFPPIGGPTPFQHAPAPLTNSLAGWMANPSSVPHQAVSVGPMGLTPPNHAVSMLKRPRTPPTNNPALDYQTADSEHVLKRSRPFGMPEELCVWSLDGWEKKASKFLQIPFGRASNHLAPTRVQFHQDQTHFLVVHETQIAIYEAPKLECIKQWVPRESSPLITDATYSCDSQSIYTCFEDGSVNVFTAAGLKLRCRINPTAYLPSTPSSRVYPLVITAHPTEPHQFALGLTDGGVHVLEPLETEGKWGTVPPQENGAGPSMSPVASAPDQSSR
ncbi:UNVERIFIED_CONTAM: Topless-related protein 4 [Sesamum radiatum]|uniref:Topless-related protein 4 n=1 Tax=Sesamum radiatum TaxID=300843 RepID=A0AAW2WIH3_SESRA